MAISIVDLVLIAKKTKWKVYSVTTEHGIQDWNLYKNVKSCLKTITIDSGWRSIENDDDF